MRKIFLWLVVSLFTLSSAYDPATSIVYMTEEYPPGNYTQNGQLTGASVEILRAVWKKMGVPEQPILVLPWARSYHDLQNRSGTMLFTMTWTRSRDPLFQWVGPIFSASIVLVGFKGKSPPLDSAVQAKKYLSAAVRDDISELAMKALGFNNSQLLLASTFNQSVQMFRMGRVQYLCMSADALPELYKTHGMDSSQLMISAVVSEQGRYFAFHKSTEPALIKRFQKALDDIAPEQKRILGKYGLHP